MNWKSAKLGYVMGEPVKSAADVMNSGEAIKGASINWRRANSEAGN